MISKDEDATRPSLYSVDDGARRPNGALLQGEQALGTGVVVPSAGAPVGWPSELTFVALRSPLRSRRDAPKGSVRFASERS